MRETHLADLDDGAGVDAKRTLSCSGFNYLFVDIRLGECVQRTR